VGLLNARRQLRSVAHEQGRVSIATLLREANKAWHGVSLNRPDWSDNSKSVAVTGEMRRAGLWFHLILNAHHEPLDFELPALGGGQTWRRWIDTALESPHDIDDWREAPPTSSEPYRVEPHSVVMLIAGQAVGASDADREDGHQASDLGSTRPSRQRDTALAAGGQP
jgi:glycogen operon protein